MKTCGFKEGLYHGAGFAGMWRALPILLALAGLSVRILSAQAVNQASVPEQIQRLTDAMAHAQARIEQSQRELDEMRAQLAALQRQVAQGATDPATLGNTAAPVSSSASSVAQSKSTVAASQINGVRERQAIAESQIATQEQTKVESESKYPVKITGLLLLNGFVNTSAVDIAPTPTSALQGPGSTGAAVRQTILGLDARGPHLFGAHSYADFRVDFDGTPRYGSGANTYAGVYSANSTVLRIRTAHASLQWEHTEAYFSLDRPLFSPDIPSSLTAVAEPALAWSGNLWTWNPQVGVTQHLRPTGSRGVDLQAALIDVENAPQSPIGPSNAIPPSDAEQSRWPGVEARVAFRGAAQDANEDRSHFGVGGYFAPHFSNFLGHGFDSWAATLDMRLFLPARLQLTGSSYRGLALGGLGGGAYKDFAYRPATAPNTYDFSPLDDVGGWAQLKEKASERIEFNAAYGLDNVFAGELRSYAVPGVLYQDLARNRTFTGNVIYSPSAYLLFSLEYRRLETSPVAGPTAGSNIIGIGAGYKF